MSPTDADSLCCIAQWSLSSGFTSQNQSCSPGTTLKSTFLSAKSIIIRCNSFIARGWWIRCLSLVMKTEGPESVSSFLALPLTHVAG